MYPPRKKTNPDPAERLGWLSQAYTEPTPEDKEQVLQLLRKYEALDLASVLGLQATNPESSNDTKVAV